MRSAWFRWLAGAFLCVVLGFDCPALRADAPQQIVSLSPALTELVIRLGRGDALAGHTRYCNPGEAAPRSRDIGGILDPSYELLLELRPDCVLLTELTPESVEERIAGLLPEARRVRVMYNSWQSLQEGIAEIGRMLDAAPAAAALVETFRSAAADVREQPLPPLRCAVLYGILRTEAAGKGSFPGELCDLLGFENIAAGVGFSAWPTLSLEHIAATEPEVLFVADASVSAIGPASDEVLQRYRDHPVWSTIPAVRRGHIVAVPSQRLYLPDSHLPQTLLAWHAVVREWLDKRR